MSELRERILDAAAARYLEQGRTRTTVRDVADGAGVSRPTVYKYVGDAEAIKDALLEREVARFFARLSEVLADHDDLEARVVEGIAFTVEYARAHALFQAMLERDPQVVLPRLTTRAGDILALAREVLRPHLEPLPPSIDRAVAAEWIARIAISLVLTRDSAADLEEPAALRRSLRDLLRLALAEGVAR